MDSGTVESRTGGILSTGPPGGGAILAQARAADRANRAVKAVGADKADELSLASEAATALTAPTALFVRLIPPAVCVSPQAPSAARSSCSVSPFPWPRSPVALGRRT